MRPLAVLGLALGLNLWEHRHGRPTICSVTRRALCRTRHPYATFGAGAFLLGGWFVPHLLRPIRDLLTD